MDIKLYHRILDLNPRIWTWRGDILYYKNIKLSPILEVNSDNSIFLYIDFHYENQFSKILKILINSPFEFYLVTNQLNNPKIRNKNWVSLSIESYFRSLLDFKLYNSYNKLKFDPIKNLISFVNKYSNIDLIWEEYNKILPMISKKNFDYLTGEYNYKIWDEEIRDNFKSLQRDIKIKIIFNES